MLFYIEAINKSALEYIKNTRFINKFSTNGSSEKNVIEIESNISMISDFIAETVFNFYLKKTLIKEISSVYTFLSDEHADKVYADTVNSIVLNKKEVQSKIIKNRAEIYLMKNKNINTDGFFMFRLKDIYEEWLKILENTVSCFLKDRETDELLNALKQYTLLRDPLEKHIEVIPDENDGYLFYNERGERIISVFSDKGKYTSDEELINTLLLLSPMSIDLSALEDPDLLTLLKHIFESKIFT
ncbi:MAG: hypothetical protein IKK29_03715 [Christensenellaceae bacterium]|nr:hypothetical protein [Christensenellaceae bacterium]